jgi:hypothetical protein
LQQEVGEYFLCSNSVTLYCVWPWGVIILHACDDFNLMWADFS